MSWSLLLSHFSLRPFFLIEITSIFLDKVDVICSHSHCGMNYSDNLIQMELLEHYVRDDMNRNAPRTMVVLNPLKVRFSHFLCHKLLCVS